MANGTSGSRARVRYCWYMKTASTTTPAPITSGMVSGPQTLPQSCGSPSIKPNVTRNRPTVASTVPVQSNRCRRRGLRFGMRMAAMAMVTAPIGMFTKKIHSQPQSVTR